MSNEQWRPVVGFEDEYMVSDLGRVWSRPRPHVKGGILRPGGTVNPYPKVRLASRHNVWVHTLVAMAFLGPRPPGCEVRHLNGDGWDVRLANLEWGTPVQNAADKRSHGTHNNTKKNQCPRGHLLVGANLLACKLPKRQCRACNSARVFVRRKPHLDWLDFADAYYAKYMSEQDVIAA